MIIFISRILGVEGLGVYGFIFAFTGFIFSFSRLGDPVFIRDIITNKRDFSKFWGNFLILNSFISLIVYIIMVIITQVLPIPENFKFLIYLTGLILLFSIFSGTAESIFKAYQKIKVIALAGIFKDSVISGLSIFFILLGKGIFWIVISFTIGELANAVILNFILIKRFPMPHLKVDVKLCTGWIKKGFYFLMQSQIREGRFITDTLVLSFMGGLYATGLYQAPYKIAGNTLLIPLLFGTIFYPYYTDLSRTSFKKLKVCYMRYKLYIAIVSIVFCLFLFTFSKQIIILLYGNEFSKSILILKILTISLLFLSLNSHNAVLLNALKKERTCFYLLFFMFLLNLILDIILIKFCGIIGIAVSTVICSIVYFVVSEYYIKKFLLNRNDFGAPIS